MTCHTFTVLFDPMDLLFLTFSSADVIINTATRGRQLTGILNTGRNKLLSQSNYMVVLTENEHDKRWTEGQPPSAVINMLQALI